MIDSVDKMCQIQFISRYINHNSYADISNITKRYTGFQLSTKLSNNNVQCHNRIQQYIIIPFHTIIPHHHYNYHTMIDNVTLQTIILHHLSIKYVQRKVPQPCLKKFEPSLILLLLLLFNITVNSCGKSGLKQKSTATDSPTQDHIATDMIPTQNFSLSNTTECHG